MKQFFILTIIIVSFIPKIVSGDLLDTWTVRQTGFSYNLTGISYGAGIYVATGNPGILLTSTDAITWSPQNLGTSNWLGDVAYGNSTFVVVGQSGIIFSSTDGVSWTPRNSGTTANFNRIRFLNGQFITVGDQSTVLTSYDGINWTERNAGNQSPYNLYYANFGNGVYVISGASDPILVSTDLNNWTAENIGENAGGDVVYGNGLFVNVVTDGLIMTSPDGLSWTRQGYLPNGNGFAGADFAQGNFVGVGSEETIFSSSNGTNWIQHYSGSLNLWNVKYLNGTFIAVGDNGTILQTASANSLTNGLVNWWPGDDNAVDIVGGDNGVLQGGITFVIGLVGQSFNLDGSSSFVSTTSLVTNPQTFSLSLWCKTASTKGGVLLGFGDTQTGFSPNYDRNIYMDDSGIIHFGVWTGSAALVNSSASYNDTSWHHVVGTYSANTGLNLYIDGNLVANNPSVSSAQNYNGWWRIGENTLAVSGQPWPYEPASFYFNGQIEDVRIYNRVLAASEVQRLYSLPDGYPLYSLTIVQTNRTPTAAEIAPLLAALPITSQLLVYYDGIFTNDTSSIDPNQPTIVLTHGWIPTFHGTNLFSNGGSDGWPTTMALQLRANGVFIGNIVAWDWSYVARSDISSPGIPEQQAVDQGQILGEKLLLALGANYSKPIQFIGHSLGTLVNGYAANYLHGDRWAWENESPFPWPGTNTLMTLFDEAEVARDFTNFDAWINILFDKNGNPFTPPKPYDHPLPKQFAWAENYVAAVGLLQTNAANVILTNDFPANAPDVASWLGEFATFHTYPINWYINTIQSYNSAMGYVWPFFWSRGDVQFTNAPSSAGMVYVQTGSEYNLMATNWNYGTNLLAARYQAYRNALAYSLEGGAPDSAAVNGNGNGEYVLDALPAFESAITGIIFHLLTTPANTLPASQLKVHPFGLTPNDANSNTNIPAYAWMPLAIPANAVSLSFDYMIQGDWQIDLLAAAFNGTNVLSLPGSQIETNILFSSGSIDVSAFAGQTNEFFIGIIGGTSTNAQLTVENLVFSISSPPLLQGQVAGNSVAVSWPLSAANYALETSTNLTDTNSWTTITNLPAIVSLQNTITNEISEPSRFYRLIKQ